ncbi:MAG: ABC transporter permease [Planctomycetes bacterium]|nr:ABC transporter permease [Planctomycetota bacterium]NBY03281.1 ABC transporter permease [Planctomycetota bacterium]
MDSLIFATLFVERDPLSWVDVPSGILQWVQSVGGFAFLGLVLWLIFGWTRTSVVEKNRIPAWKKILFSALAGSGLILFVITIGLRFTNANKYEATQNAKFHENLQILASALCLAAILLPFIFNIPKFSLMRIFGLAKLSFQEALRRKVIYAFAALLLIFLFASWFIPYKPEDQVRSYVQVVYWAMSPLFLLTSSLLAAFSIPADIKSQTIHTIVTKPVERFEIIVGRFLGFIALMTVVLLIMTATSLLYVIRGIDPAAASESLKARVPLYGELSFLNTENDKKGDNVGREWEYRSYIAGPGMGGKGTATAVWTFPFPPTNLSDREKVRAEFTFDIYRTTKGRENRGVACSFTFQTWRYREGDDKIYEREKRQALLSRNGKSDAQIENELAEKYGYYVFPSKPIFDYQTLSLDIPAGLFKNASSADNNRATELRSSNRPIEPIKVKVTCLDPTQYIGMAKYDLYFRADDPDSTNEKLWFSLNFFKGSIGLWLRMCLVTGIAVCLSTYLTGVISLLFTMILYMGGLVQEFIQQVAMGQNPGGGPVESLFRLVRRENMAAPLEQTTANQIATASDVFFRWIIRRLLDIIPDVERLDFTVFVAEGFDISGTQLILNALILVGYLTPWAILAYFLLRWREIASS